MGKVDKGLIPEEAKIMTFELNCREENYYTERQVELREINIKLLRLGDWTDTG